VKNAHKFGTDLNLRQSITTLYYLARIYCRDNNILERLETESVKKVSFFLFKK
jgi:hypothetical protein